MISHDCHDIVRLQWYFAIASILEAFSRLICGKTIAILQLSLKSEYSSTTQLAKIIWLHKITVDLFEERPALL